MSNEQTIWARHMESVQQQEKALEDRWKRDRRERIATAAMQGLLAAPITPRDGTAKGFAKLAIEFTDALIKELDKPEEEQT